MSEEDKKLLLEMKHNCLKDNGTTNETYNDSKRIKKAKAIDNVLLEIEKRDNIIKEVREWAVKNSFSNGISSSTFFMPNAYANELLEILDKVDKE